MVFLLFMISVILSCFLLFFQFKFHFSKFYCVMPSIASQFYLWLSLLFLTSCFSSWSIFLYTLSCQLIHRRPFSMGSLTIVIHVLDLVRFSGKNRQPV